MMNYIEQFMRESNAIEGEYDYDLPKIGGRYQGKLYVRDITEATIFLHSPLTEDSLKELHLNLSEGRNIRRGEWRQCNVRVGNYQAPSPVALDNLMTEYFQDLPDMNAFQAHVRFEQIHPFEDLNGRTGRLIWLHKMGGECKLSFLHQFYYQCLSNS